MTTFADNSSGNNAVMDDAKLVHEVEKHPALYNPKRRDYKDAGEMDRSWLQIANELGMKPIDVKNRWRCLRDKFVRERKRLVLDGEASYRSRDPWPLLDDMSFLWDFINHRKKGSKIRGEYLQQNLQPILPRPSPERVNMELVTSDTSLQPATNSKVLNFPAIDVEPMRIKRDPSDRGDDFDDDSPPTSRLRASNQITHQDDSSDDIQPSNLLADPPVSHKMTPDEDELFCLSVAASLRRFNSQKKALAKLRIQQVLYDVEFLD